nr:hypothetical protein [Deltaproteobacteria bacterium]
MWSVTNRWSDTDTVAARAAGVAWPAGSGLDWEQKYERWLNSFRRVAREGGYGHTIQVPTPYGDRVIGAPTLECAEVAVFLRVAFASFYHLPFFLQGWDSQGRQVLYAGHFGFVNRTGQRVGRFPLFRTQYRDHESAWRAGAAWPKDATLRNYHLGSDDTVPWPPRRGPVRRGGRVLRRDVPQQARRVLHAPGAALLREHQPRRRGQHVPCAGQAIAPGDVLLERWQRTGIGHTIPVVRVSEPMTGRFAVDVISGSMPRRQPVWDDPASARRYFTLANTGGAGLGRRGLRDAGRRLRRWRTAALRDGQWMNEVSTRDREVAIDEADHASISARPTRFGEILVVPSLEDRRNAALGQIRSARQHLRMYPASCSARARREDAFEDLYRIEEEAGRSRAQTDGTHRMLEDWVFGELTYDRSRTCCWNSSTAAMAEVILDYAETEQRSNAAMGMCAAPTVFRAEGASTTSDGYRRWREHAATMGRGADWRMWSEDEPCMARGNTDDVPSGRGPTFTCR